MQNAVIIIDGRVEHHKYLCTLRGKPHDRGDESRLVQGAWTGASRRRGRTRRNTWSPLAFRLFSAATPERLLAATCSHTPRASAGLPMALLANQHFFLRNGRQQAQVSMPPARRGGGHFACCRCNGAGRPSLPNEAEREQPTCRDWAREFLSHKSRGQCRNGQARDPGSVICQCARHTSW